MRHFTDALFEDFSLIESIVYKDISDLTRFKKDAIETFGYHESLPDKVLQHVMKEIYIEDTLVGYIGAYEHEGKPEDTFKKALCIINFMTINKGKGYGTAIIKDMIERFKDRYDLIYCLVDKTNSGAINFYKKFGKVQDNSPTDEAYFVTFWDKNENKD